MKSAVLENLEDLIKKSVEVSNTLLLDIVDHVRKKVVVSDRVSSELLENYQFEAHGVAWIATYVESLRQMLRWSQVSKEENKFNTMEKLILQIGFGEYLSQLKNGIPMSQTEFIRIQDIDLSTEIINKFLVPEVEILIKFGNTQSAREQLCHLMQDSLGVSTYGFSGLDDDLEMVREQFRRFSDEKVAPFAHQWHLKDELIPNEIINEMAELGVFGLTIPEKYGGFGLSKAAMCVVSEELSRGYIGVGSLGTRSEIAAELILCGGTEEQKKNWLPKISDLSLIHI